MAQSRLWSDLRRMPLRMRALFTALLACACIVSVATLFIIIQIIRIQWAGVQESSAPVEQAHPAPEHHELAPFAQTYELQGMTISLTNRNQTSLGSADFTLVLDCPDAETKQWMEMNRASIRDAVYESTISFTIEEARTTAGYEKVKQAILEGLKARFGVRAPRGVAIKDWLIR